MSNNLTNVTSNSDVWNSPTTEQQSEWHFSPVIGLPQSFSNNTLVNQSQQLWSLNKGRDGVGNDSTDMNKGELNSNLSIDTTETSGIWQGLTTSGSKDWELSSGLHGIGEWTLPTTTSSMWGDNSKPISLSMDMDSHTAGGKTVASSGSNASGNGDVSVDVVTRSEFSNASWGAADSRPCSWPGSEVCGGSNENGSQWIDYSKKQVPSDEAVTIQPPVQSLPPTKEELLRRAQEEEFSRLLNNNAGWGQRRIDQSTPWDVGGTRDERKQMDTMIWNHEPNNGTGIWETFYEQQGALPAHWRNQQSHNEAGWCPETSDNRASGGSEWRDGENRWNGSGDDGHDAASFDWTANGKPRGNNNSWTSDMRNAAATSGSWSTNTRAEEWPRQNNDSDWPSQPNTPTGTNAGPQWNDRPEDSAVNWNNDGMRRPSTTNSVRGGRAPEMRSQALKNLMDMGYSKQDAQNALIMHNMDMESAMQDLMSSRLAADRGGGMPAELGGTNLDMNGIGLGAARAPNMHNAPSSFSLPPAVNNQAPPARTALNQQQQLMRQQIIQQLRYAVQNRLLSPNMLISSGNNMTPKDLQLIQQLVQAQTSLSKLTNQRNQMIRQMQMSTSHNPSAVQAFQVQLQYLNQVIERTQSQISLLSKTIQTQQDSMTSATGGSNGGLRDDASMLADTMSGLKVASNNDMMTSGRGEGSRISNWKMTSIDNSQSNSSLQAGGATYNYNTTPTDPHQANDSSGPVMDNIPEFVPGQPWQGGFKDDPSLTPAAMNSMLGVRSEHLARLANGDGNVAVGSTRMSAPRYGAPRAALRGFNNNPLPTNVMEVTSWTQDQAAFSKMQQASAFAKSQKWILIRNLQPNISLEVLKMVCSQQGQVLGMQNHPAGHWTLVRFASHDEAAKAHRQLSSIPCGEISLCGDQEAQRLMHEVTHSAFNVFSAQQQQQQRGRWPAANGGTWDHSAGGLQHLSSMGSDELLGM